MRAIVLGLAGVAALWATPVLADPAYKAKDIIAYVQKAKTAKVGLSRSICFEGENDCKAAAAPKPFDLLVNFEFDSDRLTQSAQVNLDEFAQALRDPQLKGQKFAIDGFTDATGTEMYNLHLSERRAEAVISYLNQRGVERGNLVPKGFGPTKPRAADPFDPVNRRVETHLVE